MNKTFKFGITVATIGALALSSVGAFAGTTGVASAIKGGHSNILDLMLKDGVVTQAQIDTYSAKVSEERKAEQTAAIQALVTKGTLTQAKADAVLAAIEANKAQRDALKTKLEGMTAEEVKAYMEANPVKKADMLQTLVDNGTLTTADVEALKGVVGHGGEGFGGGKGHGKGQPGQKPAGTKTNTTETTTN